MTVPSYLLSFVLLAAAASAKPVIAARNAPVSFPIHHNVKEANVKDLFKQDSWHLQNLAAATNADGDSIEVDSYAAPAIGVVGGYLAPILIGQTQYNLYIDSGSAFTWLGDNPKNPYTPSPESTKCDESFEIRYSVGNATGNTYMDVLSLAQGLSFKHRIGVTDKTGTLGYDGILGIGPSTLNTKVLKPPTKEPSPTVSDDLVSQNKIGHSLFGLSYAPFNFLDKNSNIGNISWGECDMTKCVGDLTWIDVTKADIARQYGGVDLKATYGSDKNLLLSSAGVIDSGMSLNVMEPKAVKTYKDLVGAQWDNSIGLPLLKIFRNQTSNLKSLYFNFGDATFEYKPSAQIMPIEVSRELSGGKDDYHFLTITAFPPNGQPKGIGFALGYYFIMRFYSCFDWENMRVGIAKTINS